jgi:hypothetical protein
MAAKSHGTRQRYGAGCRCDECKAAQRAYQRNYRERRANGETRPRSAPVVVAELPPVEVVTLSPPGPVELAVEAELHGLPAAQTRPTLAAVALAMARILDGRVPTPKPAAAKALVSAMDALHKGSTQRRGNLALVKSMTKNSPSA